MEIQKPLDIFKNPPSYIGKLKHTGGHGHHWSLATPQSNCDEDQDAKHNTEDY